MEKKVMEVLQKVDRGIAAYSGKNLFDEGLLDSFLIIEIVAGLEEAFSVEIDPGYITEENFETPAVIAAFIKKIVS